MIQIMSFLPTLGLILAGIYFYLFYRLMYKSYPSEGERYEKEMKSMPKVLILIFLFGLLFLVEAFNFRILIAVLIVVDVSIESALQYKKLKELNFNPDFIRQLRNISYVAGVGTCFILVPFII